MLPKPVILICYEHRYFGVNTTITTRSFYNWTVLVSEFAYALPADLIAQEPIADRSASRLLRLNRQTGGLTDASFRDFPDFLRSDDLVVFNNTRVFPARLYGRF